MPEDIRKQKDGPGPREGRGDGAAYRGGYGAGGLGSGSENDPNSWDAPGVTPDGRRTGSSSDAPPPDAGEASAPDPDSEG